MVNMGLLDSKCIRFYRRACKKPKRQQQGKALRSLEELNDEPDSDSDASSTEAMEPSGECSIGRVYFADARLNLWQGVKSMVPLSHFTGEAPSYPSVAGTCSTRKSMQELIEGAGCQQQHQHHSLEETADLADEKRRHPELGEPQDSQPQGSQELQKVQVFSISEERAHRVGDTDAAHVSKLFATRVPVEADPEVAANVDGLSVWYAI
mmetsp:Transcript_45644/g.83586  ORF Transcript_45644/g.83586 Transcript_45644/m.83586 type:complete len:208 (+) Transcript_45644:72-695(+)